MNKISFLLDPNLLPSYKRATSQYREFQLHIKFYNPLSKQSTIFYFFCRFAKKASTLAAKSGEAKVSLTV